MSEFKGTPGPYVVVPIEKHPYGLLIKSIATDDVILSQDSPAWSSKQRSLQDNICGVGFQGEALSEVLAMIERQQANAKLFAASFDLLQALQLVATHDAYLLGKLLLKTMEVVHSAIRKATT